MNTWRQTRPAQPARRDSAADLARKAQNDLLALRIGALLDRVKALPETVRRLVRDEAERRGGG
jgi:hypothetical protein